MGMLAADINDAGITVLSANDIVYREPGFALLEDEGLTTGLDAYKVARVKPRRIHNNYWSQLTIETLADNRFHHLTAADLVSRQLEQIWQKASQYGDEVVIAVPAYMQTENLSLFLGICDELKIPVAGLVDAAIASTRREYRNASLVHVDMSLHSALLTRVGQNGFAQAEKSAVVDDSGMVSLFEAWIRMLSDAFVQQSRFDPLHTAETEQLLLDSMPGWLADAASGGRIELSLGYQGISHSAEVDALTLIAAAAPAYQRIVSQLRALYRADEFPAIQLTSRAARMPGLADMLKARVGGEVFLLESAATARGVLARCTDDRAGDGQVSLVRQLPWDRAPIEMEPVASTSGGGRPTHVLFENVAYSIDERPLNLGSQVVSDERTIELRQDMPGVSRKHCAVQQENGQCVLQDFSRYGTFLNGHKLDGSAVLQVGDLIRLGTPGYELRLIRTERSSGS